MFYRLTSSRKHYYEALRINVSLTGNYTFSSDSSIDTYGYLFKNEFNPSLLCKNIMVENDDAMKDMLQFEIQSELQSSNIYILVVTTYRSNTTGKFAIVVKGPAKIILVRMNDTESSSG